MTVPTITVTTQVELDAAIAAHGQHSTYTIVIDSPAGVWLSLDQATRAQVSVRGVSNVGPVGGQATVRDVWDQATVRDVRDQATVRDVWGNASLRLFGAATATNIGPHVTVMVHSAQVKVDGGHIIDLSTLDQSDPQTWCELTGVRVVNGAARLFKAVDDNLNAGHQHALTEYPIGATITDPLLRDDHSCGGELHTCPTPRLARDHYQQATRYLEVSVPLATLRPIDDTKAKSPAVTVIREVDIDGAEVTR